MNVLTALTITIKVFLKDIHQHHFLFGILLGGNPNKGQARADTVQHYIPVFFMKPQYC